jgi:hypothetical protein
MGFSSVLLPTDHYTTGEVHQSLFNSPSYWQFTIPVICSVKLHNLVELTSIWRICSLRLHSTRTFLLLYCEGRGTRLLWNIWNIFTFQMTVISIVVAMRHKEFSYSWCCRSKQVKSDPGNRSYGPVELCVVRDSTLARREAHGWRRGSHPYTLALLYSPETFFFYVEALCHEPEGCKFDTEWSEWISSIYQILAAVLGPGRLLSL